MTPSGTRWTSCTPTTRTASCSAAPRWPLRRSRIGDKQAAKQISALRKPTRSAFTINALARRDPDGVAELVELGEQLRQAERSVDPKQIRELTSRRRRLVNDLTKRAFENVDERDPSSAVRDEVVSTLTAALADPDVAAQVADGTLVKPARWEGFGFGGSPDLTVVGGTGGPRATKTPADTAGGAGTSGPQRIPRPSTKGMSREEREQARRRAAEQEEQRKAEEQAERKAAAEVAARARIAEAEQAADDAEEAYLLAEDEEQTRVERLRDLEEQVAQAAPRGRRGPDHPAASRDPAAAHP